MWTNSEDLSIIADIYQVKIKVITTKGRNDKNPTVNWISPDVGLQKYSQLQGVDLGEMTLLHEDEVHFNLVIDKKSDLAVLGSLSNRFNVGPLTKTNKDVNSDYESNGKVESDKELETVEELRKVLKRCENEKKVIKDQYIKCETELRKRTEEIVKLKIEVKDLKQLHSLGDKLKDVEDLASKKQSYEEENIPERNVQDSNSNDSVWKSGIKRRFSKNSFQNRSSTKTGVVFEVEYNCTDCDFQGTSELLLNKHINLKHTRPIDRTEVIILI